MLILFWYEESVKKDKCRSTNNNNVSKTYMSVDIYMASIFLQKYNRFVSKFIAYMLRQ